MADKKIWLVQVSHEEKARAVKASTTYRAWLHVAREVVGEPRKATPEDGWRLAEEGVKIVEAKEEGE